MFAQFRAQYPEGKIQTELLPKIDGMHLFRVTVSDGDRPLSTATAADADLETAEERAIRRALEFAGIQDEPSYPPPKQAHLEPLQLPAMKFNGATPAPEPETIPTANEPLDLSELIAMTDVEIERLGWTPEQGRKHLQKTFNKQSRQRLTPQELKLFLDHLKSQPTPYF
ncbi:MAG: hypothetical protein HC919_11395 [Oscillatoriales cyanobacterium SM2_2_1]|nr:hypothetical protein [Oscillatoriales cyanobacterium SM2_2_1]